MHVSRLVAIALIAVSCASAGRYPTSVGDADASITNAERLIDEARTAGAATSAADAFASAERNLAEAKALRDGRKGERAAVRARMAEADAMYARALAERSTATGARDEAQRQYNALPPGGTQ